MFDEETRTNIQRNLTGFGNAFAGRGPQLNEAFGTLRRLAESSQPVLRAIVAPSTDFDGFWRALEAIAATVAPVAVTQADLFVALDRTFAAFARVSRPFIQETISKSPPFLDAAIEDLPVLRPFLRDSGRFFTALGPGAKALAETSPTIEAALRRRRPGAQPVAGAVRPARADCRRAARLPGSAGSLQRARPPDRHQRTAQAGDPLPRAGADGLQLPDDQLPQPGRHLQRKQRRRQLGGRAGHRGAVRAERRDDARLGAGERARNGEPPPLSTSTRTPPRRGRPGVRGRQRALRKGRDQDRQRARQPGDEDVGAASGGNR